MALHLNVLLDTCVCVREPECVQSGREASVTFYVTGAGIIKQVQCVKEVPVKHAEVCRPDTMHRSAWISLTARCDILV